MINKIVLVVTGLIISVISSTGYLGIFGLMMAESALIPIPSEITMTFAGYLASIGKFDLVIVILVGTVANLTGSILAYWLGRWGQEAVVRKLIKKYGKYLLITEREYNHSEKWFKQYGERITLFSRVLPIIRTFISLPAGVAAMDFGRFSLFTFIGSLIWSGILTYIGYILGKNWDSLHPYYQKFEYVIIFVCAALAVYYIWHKVSKLHKKK